MGTIKADPSKVQADAEWLTTENRKQLQYFLGFANFYQCFIKYSSVAAPLNKLSLTNVPFSWTLEAEKAFLELNNWFVFAPILTQP